MFHKDLAPCTALDTINPSRNKRSDCIALYLDATLPYIGHKLDWLRITNFRTRKLLAKVHSVCARSRTTLISSDKRSFDDQLQLCRVITKMARTRIS